MDIYTTDTSNKSTLLLSKLFEDYASDCAYVKRLRSATISSYRDVFTTFGIIMPEVTQLRDVHPQMFNEFFKRLSTRERKVGRNKIKVGIKSSTTRTYYNKLMAFFKWLEDYDYIEKGSVTKKVSKPALPKYEDEKALSDSEISKIITAISIYALDDDFIRSRDLAIVLLLLYTGIRKGELLGLRVQDVDFESQTLHINGNTSKSKRNRQIPMHFSLITHLKSYLRQRKGKGYLTPQLIVSSRYDRGLTQHGLKHWSAKYSKAAAVPFHLHRFRHTFACTLAKTNADIISIMRILGHCSTKTTEQYLRSIKTSNSRIFIDKISF